ncbi:hypothetical protein EIP91_011342 [Steccherinum ochraceum]|uniref:Uncharacterized protein n=1 Tax=Steccherinum ochraceum TaxID=92696 RepID=A0A4R0RBH3_9APHY|nr:hypothetical protein EIP91_011342 [Steccherinum ochraceum]
MDFNATTLDTELQKLRLRVQITQLQAVLASSRRAYRASLRESLNVQLALENRIQTECSRTNDAMQSIIALKANIREEDRRHSAVIQAVQARLQEQIGYRRYAVENQQAIKRRIMDSEGMEHALDIRLQILSNKNTRIARTLHRLNAELSHLRQEVVVLEDSCTRKAGQLRDGRNVEAAASCTVD